MGILFEWFPEMHRNSPILAGLMVPLYMAAIGVLFAVLTDFILKFTGIHLGDYKKEYDEILDENEAKSPK